MRVLRYSMMGMGAAVTLYGIRGLLTTPEIGHPAGLVSVGEWLAGGVLLHDALLAPVVFVLCWLAARRVGPRTRRALAALLLVAGAATLVAMPILLHGRVAIR